MYTYVKYIDRHLIDNFKQLPKVNHCKEDLYILMKYIKSLNLEWHYVCLYCLRKFKYDQIPHACTPVYLPCAMKIVKVCVVQRGLCSRTET